MDSLLKHRNQTIFRFLKVMAALAGLFLVISFTLPALANLDDEIQHNENKLSGLEQHGHSISAQINQLGAEIAKLKKDLRDTEANLQTTQAEIEGLNTEIAKQKSILADVIRDLYSKGQVSTLEMLASSETFVEFINKTDYLDLAQQSVQETLTKIRDAKAALETKEEELTHLKNQLGIQKSALEQQIAQQRQLQAMNKKQISVTEEKLRELYAQYSQVLQAGFCSKSLPETGTPVSRGEVIGYQGNSGFSSGSHLHFSAKGTGGCFNPESLLRSGTFRVPLAGCSASLECKTSGYGQRCFGGYCDFHSGIDLSESSGTSVLAAEDGIIVARVSGSGCSRNTWPGGPVSGGCHVIIYHPSRNQYTGYYHLAG